MYDLRCECGKLLGKTQDATVAPSLRLWCKDCKGERVPVVVRCEVTPTVSPEPRSEQET
jgi:hypothetical protein